MKNQGISITGGTVQVGAMAVGKAASASNYVAAEPPGTVDELRVRMTELLVQMRAESGALVDPQRTLAMGEMAERELAQDQPDKRSLVEALRSVAAGVGSVASLAGAVVSLQQAVGVLF